MIASDGGRDSGTSMRKKRPGATGATQESALSGPDNSV